jgi:hypothetical protein
MLSKVDFMGCYSHLAVLLSGLLVSAMAQASDTIPTPHTAPKSFANRPIGKPATVFLWYSDGLIQPEDGPYCAGLKPPAWQCNFGATLDDCRRQVQTYLDRWYADFNIVFSFARPRSSDYYTVIITSHGGWCSLNTTEAGVAPFNCNDTPGQTAFAFECSKSAHDCAAIIAHEHAHMVGLEHTASAIDLMFPTILANTDGFQDTELRAPEALCSPKQNSYQMMLSQLGPWPGGDKPSPFTETPDGGAVATPDADHPFDARNTGSGGGTGPFLPTGDAGISLLAGYDAVSPPSLPDDTTQLPVIPPSKNGGCQFATGAYPTNLGFLVIGGLLFVLRWRTRHSR